jgi:hypothetical protein
VNNPDDKRRPRMGSAAFDEGRGTELIERLLDIADEQEARRVIEAIAPEGSRMYAYLLKCWRLGAMIL